MQVKVWNDNEHPYNEQFREMKIHIPAKSWIAMDKDTAELFRGSFAPIKRDADGNPIPEGYKKIRIEYDADFRPAEVVTKTTICNSCRYSASSETDLAEHLKTHASEMVTDMEAEAEIKTKAKKKSA